MGVFPFWNLASIPGPPLPTWYIRIKTLRKLSRQSLERDGVKGKVLVNQRVTDYLIEKAIQLISQLSVLWKMSKTDRLPRN